MKVTSKVFLSCGQAWFARPIGASAATASTDRRHAGSSLQRSSFVSANLAHAQSVWQATSAVREIFRRDTEPGRLSRRAVPQTEAARRDIQADERAWLTAERWIRGITWSFVAVTVLVDLAETFGPRVGLTWLFD